MSPVSHKNIALVGKAAIRERNRAKSGRCLVIAFVVVGDGIHID